jgi:hypothetical protein
MVWLSIVATAVVAFLGWNLYRRFGADRMAELTERRRGTSRMVSRGDFVDGNRHLDVVLSLTQSTFFYENADMEASVELQWVSEVEYDDGLATGGAIKGGKVLRLRCYSQVFEFVLPTEFVPRWHMMLPPRRTLYPAVALAGAIAT